MAQLALPQIIIPPGPPGDPGADGSAVRVGCGGASIRQMATAASCCPAEAAQAPSLLTQTKRAGPACTRYSFKAVRPRAAQGRRQGGRGGPRAGGGISDECWGMIWPGKERTAKWVDPTEEKVRGSREERGGRQG